MAGSPLGGAFLLNALLRVSNGNCCGKLIQAVVINNACPKIGGISITLLGKASRIASGIVDAFFLTVLKSGEAFGITLAGAKLVFAFCLDALNWGTDVHHGSHWLNGGSVASVGGGAFGSIDRGLAALSWETEGPTRLL